MNPELAKTIIRRIDTIIEDAVHLRDHLRQGDPSDVIDLAENIESLAMDIRSDIDPQDPALPETMRMLFADL